MFMQTRLIVAATAVALLAGCATQNPYDNQPPSSNNTAKYGAIGALAGAAAGALINHDNRGKGALIGAAAAGAVAFGTEAKPGSPADFAAFIAAQHRKWSEVGKAAGVKLD